MSTPRTSREWHDLDRRQLLHPFTDINTYSTTGGRVIERAQHVYIYDTDGNEILDGMSGLWCCGLGYSQDAIAEAVYKQLGQLPYYNSFFNCTNDIAIEMTSRLLAVAPKHMQRVFFTNSGSEANDTNIRLVHRYFDMLGKPDKKLIISRENAYHGSTIAAASLGGMKPMHEQFTGLSYVHHIQQPYWFGSDRKLDADAFGLQAAQALSHKIDELGEHNVAAFIAEPIQGAGGVIVPPETYWPEIQRICNERDILLISDEVICGFGRTGNWFGCDTYQTKPDLITFAKGVTNGYQPLGGVMIGDRMSEVLASGGGEFTHGFTYSGHPAACAAGIATLQIMQEQDTIGHVNTTLSPHFEKHWFALADHPVVGEARFKGFVGALELVRDKESGERLAPKSAATAYCRDVAIESGLMIRAVGDTIICSPPYVCSLEELDLLIERLTNALVRTSREFGVKQ